MREMILISVLFFHHGGAVTVERYVVVIRLKSHLALVVLSQINSAALSENTKHGVKGKI